ncbi:MAG: cytochrome c [Campylobacterales bacterium]|nr:cytochrome c [Campylobacterales bacterium]
MKTIILSSLALLLFSACDSEPTHEKTTQRASKPKIEAVNEATKNVETLNAAAKENRTQAEAEIKLKTEPAIAAKSDALNGATLYANKCASCHGKDGKKSALNNSAPIAGWKSERLITVLKGYKDGGYGGKMKAIMQGQSKPLSDTEIKLLSHYISTL